MELSAAFATTLQTPDHVKIAEDLGYRRAWLYDTPQQSPDVWMALALAATRTERIGLGPGVLVPSLRHPMVNAAGAAALAQLAPDRVAIGFGTGFTGRRAMGQPKPIPWSYMTAYIGVFRGLLRGETVEWEGARLRMLHSDESRPPLPLDLPIYISALGPKGLEIAQELADGLFVVSSVPAAASGFDDVAYLVYGTVLGEVEQITDERVRLAGGPGAILTLHAAYETVGADVVGTLPGGRAWLEVVRAVPEDVRHLAVHEGHCRYLNAADSAAWDEGGHNLLNDFTLTGTADQVRAKVERYLDQGVTELVYQPVGDVHRELEALAAALDGL